MTTGAWIVLVSFFVLVFGIGRMIMYFKKEGKKAIITDGLLRLLFLDIIWEIFKWCFVKLTSLFDLIFEEKDARNN